MNSPDWICNPCARLLCGFYIDGRWVGPASHLATYHMGRCGVCGCEDAVTEPRDHGGMVRGWEQIPRRRTQP
jgi:hypothetical protein